MLDWAHSAILEAVARGDETDETPALDDLVAVGLVERVSGAPHRLTPAGERALALGKPSRVERIAVRVMAVALVVFAIATIGDWVA